MDIGLLILRAVVGSLFVGHGTQKLLGWFGGGGPSGTGQFFGSLGYPRPKTMALLAGATETGAGAMFALGLATPLAAAGIVGVMINAIAAAHGRNGLWITKGGYEYNLVLIAVAVGVAWIGPGRISIDELIAWYPARPIAGAFALGLGALGAAGILATRSPQAAEQTAHPEQRRPQRAA